jgi:ketosteroid isomerase-like protein
MAHTAIVDRLCRALDEHDLEALVACFDEDFHNETPAHPERGFRGSAQVRANWARIFAAVPDLSVEVVRSAVDGDTVWTEWEHRGTRQDGTAHLMRGVVIFGVGDGRATWARFYLEPVEEGGGGVEDAIRRQLEHAPTAVTSSRVAS